ncbi:hypothetical protein [Streptomyces sp. NBC_00385]|uniref:hypothetical protein n=1 Tax=Streptomyces sp. NBC_00385 TaxID=2975733 RepID=UPI002DD8F4C8|nr:hypothetical protein [Streptomyces sp. NBC_00385]WRZ05180.1 hypothetical protein OG959_18450 [Streptomyces sp. NBC_00385]
MRIRTTTAAIAAVLAFAVVGCSSGNDSDSKADTAPSSAAEASSGADDRVTTADDSGAGKETVLPPEPTGAERDAVLAAVRDVNGNLTHDEDKAIDAARNQCAALDGGAANADHTAAQRFSYDGITLTDDDGSHINIGLRKTLCPAS